MTDINTDVRHRGDTLNRRKALAATCTLAALAEREGISTAAMRAYCTRHAIAATDFTPPADGATAPRRLGRPTAAALSERLDSGSTDSSTGMLAERRQMAETMTIVEMAKAAGTSRQAMSAYCLKYEITPKPSRLGRRPKPDPNREARKAAAAAAAEAKRKASEEKIARRRKLSEDYGLVGMAELEGISTIAMRSFCLRHGITPWGAVWSAQQPDNTNSATDETSAQ